MITQLQTVKDRLRLTDIIDDDYLTGLINACGALFDRECNRVFERGEAVNQEFRGDELDISLTRYPVETIIGFELKSNEEDGWEDVSPDPISVLRFDCVLSLTFALGSNFDQARVSYTGGYVMPGATAEEWQHALPAEIEQVAIEQITSWYRLRNLGGISSASGDRGSVQLDPKSVVTPLSRLPIVTNVLQSYRRLQL